MQGFTPRDYVVSGLIIFGVLAAWFFLLAAFLGLIAPGLSMSLSVVIGLIVYIILKRRRPAPPKK